MAKDLDAFADLFTTTHANKTKRITSSLEDTRGLMGYMKRRDRIVDKDSGTSVEEFVQLEENKSIQNIYPGQTYDTTGGQAVQKCAFGWSLKVMTVKANGYELRTNRNASAWISLADAKDKQAQETALNRTALELFSDGAITGSIVGVRAAIRAEVAGNTGVWGGLDSADYPRWNNHHIQATLADIAPTKIRATVSKLKLKCSVGAVPDVFCVTNDLYLAYEESIQQQMRYMDKDKADGNISSLVHDNMEILHDLNADFVESGQVGFMLTSKDCYYFQHPQAKFEAEEKRMPVNADVVVIPYYAQVGFAMMKRKNSGILTV
jgi:hypothetical protein